MNSPARALLSRAGEIVGGANIIADPAEIAAYEVDGLRPAAVARPGSAEEIAELVGMAAAEKLAVIPAGARTKLAIGMPPARYDIAIDVTRLDRVLAYDPGDLTLSVEAGISAAKLSATLAEQGQFLPLAVPYANQSTIGGTLSSGVDSPLRQFYGTARDFVLGMEIVTGEGKIAKSGGRVVKNVTGYDLHKLMIGAIGSLGIITRVNFKTFPLPAPSRGFLAMFASAEAALEMRRQIAQSPVAPLTLDILSPQAAELFAGRSPKTLGMPLAPASWLTGADWVLAAGIAGSNRVLERCAAELGRMAEASQAKQTALLGDADRPLVWNRLREFVPLLLETSPAAAIFRISALPMEGARVFAALGEIAERHKLAAAGLIRGTGGIHFALLSAPRDPEALERLGRASAEIFAAAEKSGARAMLPWCPPEMKQAVNVWGAPQEDFPLFERLKKTFDPSGILAPGRFAGGL